jgi:hypothetical protein
MNETRKTYAAAISNRITRLLDKVGAELVREYAAWREKDDKPTPARFVRDCKGRRALRSAQASALLELTDAQIVDAVRVPPKAEA